VFILGTNHPAGENLENENLEKMKKNSSALELHKE
jgi:hypothetical protein